ncbi:MAG: hypothetical protein WD847_07710 [Pirellulales bacterium]
MPRSKRAAFTVIALSILTPVLSRALRTARIPRTPPRVFAAHALILIASLLTSASRAAADDALKEIIEKVRRNELIYEDIEVVLLQEYVQHDPSVDRTPRPLKPGEALIHLSSSKRTRYISQGTLFRVETDGATTTVAGDLSRDKIVSFDGVKTRILRGTVGSIREGRTEDSGFVRPHMMLLRGFSAPLSTYLSGHEAMRRRPSQRWDDSHTLQNSYQGTADFKGHPCHKVSLSSTQITDAGLAQLAGMPSLTTLDLNHTRVTDAGLEHLAGLKNLQSLRLDGTQVTIDGCDKLRRALPNCRIQR